MAVTDLQAMLRLYHAYDPDRFTTLAEWARTAKQRVWWSEYKSLVPRSYHYYLSLESEASGLSFFQDNLVPGLLQTPEYGHMILSSFTNRFDEAGIQLRWAVRMRRQQEAFGRGVQITAILDEAVLRRTVGGPAVMKGQLHHLLTLSERTHIHIRVLPFAVTDRPIHSGAFTIVELGTEDEAVVYVEAGRTEDTMERRQDVQAHRDLFTATHTATANAEDSQRLITQIADSL